MENTVNFPQEIMFSVKISGILISYYKANLPTILDYKFLKGRYIFISLIALHY